MMQLGHCLRLRSAKNILSNISGVLPVYTAKRENRVFRSRDFNPDEKVDFEVSKDPEEWTYVTRLLPLRMVPEPVAKSSYPSGWKPQHPAFGIMEVGIKYPNRSYGSRHAEPLINRGYLPATRQSSSNSRRKSKLAGEATNGPYYIRRSRNHMIPVYFSIGCRGLQKTTTIRHVFGDIWLFAKDLQEYLESKTSLSIGYKIDEVGCKVALRGDYVYYTTQFLTEKGF